MQPIRSTIHQATKRYDAHSKFDTAAASQSPLSRWLEVLRCPECGGRLNTGSPVDSRELLCRKCAAVFPIRQGIPRLIRRDAATKAEKFRNDYEAMRLAEGWASVQPGYYDVLPFVDVTGKHVREWKQRAQAFARLQRWLRHALRNPNGGERILDAGAGCGWMSRELAKQDHVVALDIDAGDHGLNAIPPARRGYLAVQGELGRFPFADGSFHVVIANASAHHTGDFETVLREAARVLRHEGWVVVMDSPTYPDETARRAAQRRSRVHFENIGYPHMADSYAGIVDGDYQQQTYFDFSRQYVDVSPMNYAIKRLREIAGQPAGARFPMWIGQRRTGPDELAQRGRYRAGVIIRHQDEILMTLARYQNVEFWHTPGGTMQLGESPQQAVLRRLRTVCNLDLTIQRELGEYLFPAHREWCFIAKPLNNEERNEFEEFRAQKTNLQVSLEWLPINRLAEIDIRPAALKMDLISIISSLIH
jgi:ubiquinone/menaquinone biosynthesis C-methylase UbiE/uncharacterized protein YbaR (Trm112 family)/ADP-ribose pyrophosphatase YjhB (NUDIX family)